MKAKTKWSGYFLGLTVLWIVSEVYSIYDGSDNTIPLTSYIINYIPWWVGFPTIVAFAIWLVHHFYHWYKVHNSVTRK